MFYRTNEIDVKKPSIVDIATIGFDYAGVHYDFKEKLKAGYNTQVYVFVDTLGNLLTLKKNSNSFSKNSYYVELMDFTNKQFNVENLVLKGVSVVNGMIKTTIEHDPVYGEPINMNDEVIKLVGDEQKIFKVVFITSESIVLERNSKLLTINKKDKCALNAYGLSYKE